MKNFIWILGLGLLALIIIVMLVIGLNLGSIVKIGMEQVGPKVTQVSIKVDAVGISLLTGSASVKGLVVGNPDGYATPQAIRVGAISVSMDPRSVMSDKIVIHSVKVESPTITFEGGLSRNNLNKILDNVRAFSPSGNPPPKIEVDDFLITGAKVHVDLSGLVSKDISLPDIHLTDLGKGNNGLTPADLTKAILKVISSDTVKAVTRSVSSLGSGAVKTVGERLDKLTSTFSGLLGK